MPAEYSHERASEDRLPVPRTRRTGVQSSSAWL